MPHPDGDAAQDRGSRSGWARARRPGPRGCEGAPARRGLTSLRLFSPASTFHAPGTWTPPTAGSELARLAKRSHPPASARWSSPHIGPTCGYATDHESRAEQQSIGYFIALDYVDELATVEHQAVSEEVRMGRVCRPEPAAPANAPASGPVRPTMKPSRGAPGPRGPCPSASHPGGHPLRSAGPYSRSRPCQGRPSGVARATRSATPTLDPATGLEALAAIRGWP